MGMGAAAAIKVLEVVKLVLEEGIMRITMAEEEETVSEVGEIPVIKVEVPVNKVLVEVVILVVAALMEEDKCKQVMAEVMVEGMVEVEVIFILVVVGVCQWEGWQEDKSRCLLLIFLQEDLPLGKPMEVHLEVVVVLGKGACRLCKGPCSNPKQFGVFIQ